MLIKIKGIEDIVNESSGFGKKKKSPGGSAVSLSDSGSKKSGVSGITDWDFIIIS